MGMIVVMHRFSKSELETYRADPSKFEDDAMSAEESETRDGTCIDLDKSWEGIHFLLTGHKLGGGEGPLSIAIYSEQFFDEDQEMGYGPASYLTPEQVASVNSALAIWDREQFRRRFVPERMNADGVYPSGWDHDPEEQFNYLWEYFNSMKEFFASASKEGQAIASYIG